MGTVFMIQISPVRRVVNSAGSDFRLSPPGSACLSANWFPLVTMMPDTYIGRDWTDAPGAGVQAMDWRGTLAA